MIPRFGLLLGALSVIIPSANGQVNVDGTRNTVITADKMEDVQDQFELADIQEESHPHAVDTDVGMLQIEGLDTLFSRLKGRCMDSEGRRYRNVKIEMSKIGDNDEDCMNFCLEFKTSNFVGFETEDKNEKMCYCDYSGDPPTPPTGSRRGPEGKKYFSKKFKGTGPVRSSNDQRGKFSCYAVKPTATPTRLPTASPTTASPTGPPTKSPSTTTPSSSPITSPTGPPTKSPSKSPSLSPTTTPSSSPSTSPTGPPTKSPTFTHRRPEFTLVGQGRCVDATGNRYEYLNVGYLGGGPDCKVFCSSLPDTTNIVGVTALKGGLKEDCRCLYSGSCPIQQEAGKPPNMVWPANSESGNRQSWYQKSQIWNRMSCPSVWYDKGAGPVAGILDECGDNCHMRSCYKNINYRK